MTSIDLPSLQDRTVLVVGASGFLGRHLVHALGALGARVIGVSRTAGPFQHPIGNVEWRPCDASASDQVARVFREIRPHIVYNLTSDSRGGQELSLIPDSIRNDIVATTNVLSEAVRFGVRRVITIGSLEEPRGDAGSVVPSSPYAAAKWCSSAYARMFSAIYGLPVTVLRLMMTYGPGQKDYKVVPYTIRSLIAGEPAKVSSGCRLLDWVYVGDVTGALLRAGISPVADAGSIDIGTGRSVPLRDVLSLVGELTGRSDLLIFGEAPDRLLEREDAANTSDAMEKLGWRATTSLRDGLRLTIEAYRAQMNARSS